MYKRRIKEYRRGIREREQQCSLIEAEHSSLQELTRQMKQNSEHLMHDLVKQQRIAKESIRALETIGDKYDREKREMMVRMEKEKEELMRREEQKFDNKVNSLKVINEQMSKKLVTLDETQEDF